MTGLRIGIDVGGTNTDAVAVDGSGSILAWCKTATTPLVFDGIGAALDTVLADVDVTEVRQVMLGTTHPVNALIQRRDLATVGVLRIAAPATLSISPLASWPRDLAGMVAGHAKIVEGGHEYQGEPLTALDTDAVREFANECRGKVEAIAITGMASPVNPEHECRAAEIVAEVLDVPVTLGHEVGGLGLLERENSAVLNAALTQIGAAVVNGLQRALDKRGFAADVYMTQNDGTLLTASEAVRRPILTIGSGPTNSMRGAAHLSGLSDAIVLDVGGTSTDVGMLVDGFPRESAFAVEIGGVRTNYRTPDLLSTGLGGGSIVTTEPSLTVGPDSVGHEIAVRALCFGGSMFTLTDASVADGRMPAPADNRPAVSAQAADVLALTDSRIATLADRIKASRDEVPLIAVGGGSHVVPEQISGITKVVRHEHGNVANAVGAAIAEASGTVDRTYRYEDGGRETSLADAREAAALAAVRAGADAQRVRITSLTEVPLGYMPGQAVRVQVRAVGPLMEN